MSDINYHQKYLKYKNKYLMRKNIQSGGGKTDVYLFKAEWCGHCQNFKPTWEKIKESLKNKYNFITMDADEHKDEIKNWNIQGFPTIIKKTGSDAREYVGPRDIESVTKFIQE
jgi:thiol-disulfide isomerase/thioredoxin